MAASRRLDGLNLDVSHGTIHAVVGENGAGKSTLLKVLAGVVRPDSGQILLEGAGRRYGIARRRACDAGSASSIRSFRCFRSARYWPIFLSIASCRGADWCRPAPCVATVEEILERLGLDVDVDAPLSRLSIGEQQLVELARVLLQDPRLLILDEPNSALNKRETERLFAVLRQLRDRGATMIYVSHRLEEVFAISDRITVARNGRDVITRVRQGLTIAEVIDAMIGAHPGGAFSPAAAGDA